MLRVQARGAARGGGSPKNPGNGVSAFVTLIAKVESAHGHRDARADVIAKNDGAQEMRAADAELFASRKSGGNDRRAGMGLRGRVRIVGLVGVSHHAVGEGRLDGTADDVRGDDRGHAAAAVGASELEGRSPGRKLRARNDGGERVEDVVLGLLRDGVRQRTVACFAHVFAEAGHQRANRFGGYAKAAGKGRGREKPACLLKQGPPG